MKREPYELVRSIWLAADRDEVFTFFADAGNLQRLTPDTLSFEIITPQPIEMAEGALIDYRLRIHGLPLRWRTRIAAWDPPRRFVDEQIRGPYRMWVHEHTFERADNGTLVRDRVRYRVPGGPLAPLIHRLFVRRDVERIFDFRERKMRELFDEASGRASTEQSTLTSV
jgi:hypothetical protein